MFSIQNLRKESNLVLILLISILFQALNLLGLSLCQASVSYDTKYNVFGLSWFFIVLYAGWAFVVLEVLGTDSLMTYKSLLTSYTALVVLASALDCDRALSFLTSFGDGTALKAGTQIRVVGLIMTCITAIFAFVLLGSEKDSFVHRIQLPLVFQSMHPRVDTLDRELAKGIPTRVEEGQRPAQILSDDRPKSVVSTNTTMQRNNSASMLILDSAAKKPIVLFQARAKFTFDASPSDPNEISFLKNDVLDVLDDTGDWWKVVKTDQYGAVVKGIVPGNYFEPL